MCGSCENCLISFHRMACVYSSPGYSTKIWVKVSRWGFETQIPFRTKKILKHIPCLGQHPQFITLFMKKDKMHAILF